MGYKKPVFSIPMGFMKFSTLYLGTFSPVPADNSDQLRLLQQDNIGVPEAVERYFGFAPMKFDDMLRNSSVDTSPASSYFTTSTSRAHDQRSLKKPLPSRNFGRRAAM